MQQALPPSPFDSFNDFSAPTTVEELLITHEDGPQFVHKLGQSIVSIGRDNSNDIVFNANNVSRNHARLEWHRGLWHIVDLGSTNGTVLGGQTILPNSTRIWPLNQTLKIGCYSLELRRHSAEFIAPDRTEFLLPDDVDPEIRELRESFEASKPIRYTANMWPTVAHNTDRICIAVQNEGNSADKFTLKMNGDTALSFSMNEWQSNIPAGLERRQTITIGPNRRPLLGASKTYAFQAELVAAQGGKRKLDGELRVDPVLSTRAFCLLVAAISTLGAIAYYAVNNLL